jgi:hypothetical protein
MIDFGEGSVIVLVPSVSGAGYPPFRIAIQCSGLTGEPGLATLPELQDSARTGVSSWP